MPIFIGSFILLWKWSLVTTRIVCFTLHNIRFVMIVMAASEFWIFCKKAVWLIQAWCVIGYWVLCLLRIRVVVIAYVLMFYFAAVGTLVALLTFSFPSWRMIALVLFLEFSVLGSVFLWFKWFFRGLVLGDIMISVFFKKAPQQIRC
jgi:hypothetical protein